MEKKIIIIFIVCNLSLCSSMVAQGSWEVFAGPSYTNVRHIQNEQQIIYNHTTNAPLWNIGFQLGVNKILLANNKIQINTGLAFQLKGDKDSRHIIFPQNEYYGIRFYYLSIPMHFYYKVLNTKDIYVFGGFSGEVLVHQNEIDQGVSFFPIDDFGDRLGLSTQIGFKFNISDRISTEINYSQYLTTIYVTESVLNDGNDIKYKHQGFELSIVYKL